jgi:tetratricopeptide (TPR) repeat protein
VVAALRGELQIAFASHDPSRDPKAIADHAFKLCPACFQVRVVYQFSLEPRWGGSYAAMAAAALAANSALNPRFKVLPGYVDRDRAQNANRANDLEQALTLIEGACARGDDAEFLLEKGAILVRRKQEALAIAAFSRALELRPQRPDLLFARADAYLRGPAPNPQAAYEDLLLGLRIEATNSKAHRALPYVVAALVHAATDAEALKDAKTALRYLDEAFDLAPSNDLEKRRARVLTMGFQGTSAELAILKRAADAAPHDFYAHQQLDYALSTFQRWDEIVAMWTAFIAQNPEDGHAFFERSGTYSHLPGMRSAAKADSVRACELGVSPACVLASRL